MIDEHSHKVHLNPEDYERLRKLRGERPAQSIVLGIWIILNGLAFIWHWDPYPFILLNLVLSFQAAYAAPIIMMSQNRH